MAAATPIRAIAISNPIANAISLPLNHFTIPFDTVIPAISTPQPKIINANDAIFADEDVVSLNGKNVQKSFKNSSAALPIKASDTAQYLTIVPITINVDDNKAVFLTPILSRMIPAKMRKNTNTFKNVSLPAYVP